MVHCGCIQRLQSLMSQICRKTWKLWCFWSTSNVFLHTKTHLFIIFSIPSSFINAVKSFLDESALFVCLFVFSQYWKQHWENMLLFFEWTDPLKISTLVQRMTGFHTAPHCLIQIMVGQIKKLQYVRVKLSAHRLLISFKRLDRSSWIICWIRGNVIMTVWTRVCNVHASVCVLIKVWGGLGKV